MSVAGLCVSLGPFTYMVLVFFLFLSFSFLIGGLLDGGCGYPTLGLACCLFSICAEVEVGSALSGRIFIL